MHEPRAGIELAAAALPIRAYSLDPTRDRLQLQQPYTTNTIYPDAYVLTANAACSSSNCGDFDWASFRAWLVGKGFTAKYVSDVMCYARRFAGAFLRGNLSGMDEHGLKGLWLWRSIWVGMMSLKC